MKLSLALLLSMLCGCTVTDQGDDFGFVAETNAIEIRFHKVVSPRREVYADVLGGHLAYYTNAKFEPYVTVNVWKLNFEKATQPTVKLAQTTPGSINQSVVIPAGVVARAAGPFEVDITLWDWDDGGRLEGTHDFIFSKKIAIDPATPWGAGTGQGQGAQMTFRYYPQGTGVPASPAQ